MSSSGRFQSRVFSFLSQQRLRLQDRMQRLWRQTQVTAAWSAQILLYPVYVAFQTTRLLSSQATRAVQRIFPGLKAASPPELPPVDAPIERTLTAVWQVLGVENPELDSTNSDSSLSNPRSLARTSSQQAIASIPSNTANPFPLSPLVPVYENGSGIALTAASLQGIASLISTRALVLVSSGNEILDILTPTQQLQLRQSIAWELASYWRDRRLYLAAHRPVNLLPLPHTEQPNLLPPVRSFLRLMAWVQRGPVAIATNLFQEATLAQYFSDLDSSDTNSLLEGEDVWFLAEQPSLAGTSRPQKLPQGNGTFSSPLLLESTRAIARTQPATIQFTEPQQTGLAERGDEAIALQNSQAANMNASRPGIEPYLDVETTLVGYEKHLLTRLLEWLDGGMLWVEEQWALFWKWLMNR